MYHDPSLPSSFNESKLGNPQGAFLGTVGIQTSITTWMFAELSFSAVSEDCLQGARVFSLHLFFPYLQTQCPCFPNI